MIRVSDAVDEEEALTVTVTSKGSSIVTKTVGGTLSVYVAMPEHAGCSDVICEGNGEEVLAGVDN